MKEAVRSVKFLETQCKKGQNLLVNIDESSEWARRKFGEAPTEKNGKRQMTSISHIQGRFSKLGSTHLHLDTTQGHLKVPFGELRGVTNLATKETT